MRPSDRDLLIEALSSAFRERDAFGRVLPAPEWYDLSPDDREAAFEAQLEARLLESAADAKGLSGTARAVMARAGALGQLNRD